MSVILLVLGILSAGAGVAAIGFGIPINDLPLGSTLIVAGATGLVGGLILVGLSATVTELTRIAEILRLRPVTRTARPAEVPEAVPASVVPAAAAAAASPPPSRLPPRAAVPPQPVPEVPHAEVPRPVAAAPANPSAVEGSASAIERLRSSIPRAERPRAESSVVAESEEVPLSPNGAPYAQPHVQPRPASPEAAPAPRVTAEDRAAEAPVDTAKRSRLDFLFRPRSGRAGATSEGDAQPQSENFDTVWSSDAPPRSREAEPPMERAPQPSHPPATETAPPEQRRAEPAPLEQRSAGILKSGVVDGMAYTLYADGSIEAKLPHGTVRFGSIAELRAHIESNS
jgi:hypothetical protein